MNTATIDPTTTAASIATATPTASPILSGGAVEATGSAKAARPARPGRPLVGGLTLAAVALLIGLDLLTTERINPFTVPPPAALGSGLATAGAHCAVMN